MNPGRHITSFLVLILAVCLTAKGLRADPVTGWLKDSFSGSGPGTVSNAGTNSPIVGNGTSNNADNTAIYAAFPLVSLAQGERITLTGAVEMIGTSPTGDFRWGLFKDDGVPPATGGWRGCLASAESLVWSKNPAAADFATATFASVAAGRGIEIGAAAEPHGIPFDPGTCDFRMTVDRFDDAVDIRIAITNDDTGFSIVSPAIQEDDPGRLTFEFDHVGFLAGSALDADRSVTAASTSRLRLLKPPRSNSTAPDWCLSPTLSVQPLI